MYILPLQFGTPEHDETVQLRNIVLRQPLGLSFSLEALAVEYAETHLACYAENHALLGCLLLKPHNSQTAQMRQVAVLPAAQRHGVGSRLVAYAETLAATKGYTLMHLHAREAAVAFYERLGYQKVGSEFVEVGIAHWAMEKPLV